MNYITINKLSDLEEVISTSVYITGKESYLNEETEYNMWAITFSEDLTKKINVKKLENFVTELIQERHNQLMKTNSKAIFYLWFDKQALQLRFNLISSNNKFLPFGCNLNILESPKTILEDFIKTMKNFNITDDVIEFFDANKEIDMDEAEEITLDVYIEVIVIK